MSATNGSIKPQLAELDASKVKINLSQTLKDIPPKDTLVFGQVMTDHMLVIDFDPANGWSTPEIKPYGPFTLDPASSCFHYATNLFEGMKAYIGPDGKPRLFRPELNMERMARSAGRVALPSFNTEELLKLIRKLVAIDSRWIPSGKGYSLYIRPTFIGTRSSLGVKASDYAKIFVICSPAAPFSLTGPKHLSILAIGEHVRSWPGGTGGHKLAANYAPTMLPQEMAIAAGYDQCLWILGEERIVTEVGGMNFFIVVKREDGDLDAITPPLDGTILPGVTRDSALKLLAAHPSQSILPGLSPSQKVHPQEARITLTEIFRYAEEGRLVEAFGIGTAPLIIPINRIGFEGKDVHLPAYHTGTSPVAEALYDRIFDIQTGQFDWEGWSVTCE